MADSATTTNGSPASPEQGQPSSPEVRSKSQRERLVFAATVLIGYRVEVQVGLQQQRLVFMRARVLGAQVVDGKVYEGVFNTAHFDGDEMHIMIKYARLRDTTALEGLAERPQKVMAIPFKNLVQIYAKDVRLNPEDLATNADEFETDAAIGRGKGG
jgi:hypothetical protein